MPNPLNETNIIAPRVPLIDERSGLIAREWYRFFLNLFVLTGSGRNDTSLLDLQVGPPIQPQIDLHNINPEPAGFAAYAAGTTQESQIAELIKQISGLQTLPVGLESQVAELQKQVNGLEMSPARTPHLYRTAYGVFYDTTSQTAAAINTAYAMTFNTTDLSVGVTIGTPTSRIYVDRSNVYNIQFSAQLDKASANKGQLYIWFRKNGIDIPYSATDVALAGSNAATVAAWNYVLPLNEGDYIELMWSVDDTGCFIKAVTATAPVPGIPSIILSVTDNISAVQYY